MMDVIVIGGGLAGLSCALELQSAGLTVSLLEASSAPGGRVQTDTIDGFLLDRGFQVMLTAYPDGKRLLNYEALKWKKFIPGAMVWHAGRFHRFADPFRTPVAGAQFLFDSIVPFSDKLHVTTLRARAQQGTLEALFARPEKTTREYLQAFSFSSTMIERFFEPFFGGVFLERELVTSSRFFEFLFRMFSIGDTAVPAAGMQQIPLQLAAALKPGTLRTATKVTRVARDGNSFRVDTANGETLQAPAVVLAVSGHEANPLIAGVGGWSVPEVREWNSTTTFCYAASEVPINEPIILLNGEGPAAGPVNNVAVMSAVSAQYAPPGQHLVVASVVGQAPQDDPSLRRLEQAVRLHLGKWFGGAASSWKMLKAYPLMYALPRQRHAEWEQNPIRLAATGGIYMCGDYRETASIQGALASGRRAAEAVSRDFAEKAQPQAF
jgi:phytoene dehydrogenase-like protein